MKPTYKILILVFAALASLLSRGVALERWEILRAINEVENPTNQTHFGSKGELGPYQFRRDTWRMYTRKPFSQAINRNSADEVAVSHFEKIKHELAGAGIDPNPFNIAMAWNCGVNGVIAGRIPTVTYRYAERVTNLAEKYHSETVATAPVREPAVRPLPVDPSGLALPAVAAASPNFKVLTDAPVLKVTGEIPLFVLPPTGPKLADAGNMGVGVTF